MLSKPHESNGHCPTMPYDAGVSDPLLLLQPLLVQQPTSSAPDLAAAPGALLLLKLALQLSAALITSI
jgi:hypothetical protein